MDLGVKPSPGEYLEFASGRIADAVQQAFRDGKPGGVSFGLGHAVVSHNRLVTYRDGRSQQYGSLNRPDFSHIGGSASRSTRCSRSPRPANSGRGWWPSAGRTSAC
jgi:hypothetical protein